jgi:histone-lysine N-methyltransferase SETD3
MSRYPNELLECLRLITIQESDLTREDGSRVPLRSVNLAKPLNDANEISVFEAIIEECRASLGRYPTTEDDDEVLMDDRPLFTSLSAKARNAIRLRRSEKRLLKKTISLAEKCLLSITSGTEAVRARPWLEPKTLVENIIDDVGVEMFQ